MAQFDVFALSSEFEGSPLALIEAMWWSRPIVATSVGGIPEMIADGESGLLVPPKSPERLADAILRLLGDATLRARLGTARARARGRGAQLRALRRGLGGSLQRALRARAADAPIGDAPGVRRRQSREERSTPAALRSGRDCGRRSAILPTDFAVTRLTHGRSSGCTA